MRSEPMYILAAGIGFLSMAACDQAVPTPASAGPPVTTYRVDNVVLDRDGISQTIRGASVTAAFFPATKALPWLGRVFTPEEYPGVVGHAAVLSHRLWQERFRADPSSIGKIVKLNGQSFTIIGVMPATFDVPPGVDVWVPKAEP